MVSKGLFVLPVRFWVSSRDHRPGACCCPGGRERHFVSEQDPHVEAAFQKGKPDDLISDPALIMPISGAKKDGSDRDTVSSSSFVLSCLDLHVCLLALQPPF